MLGNEGGYFPGADMKMWPIMDMEINQEINSQDRIDQALCSEIEKFSKQEDGFWSSINRDPREYAHSLFQYPAMMVPVVQKKIIELIIGVKPSISTMLDPYVGAGTTFTAAMSYGLDCYGQDINPLAILVSKAKTDLGWSDQNLRDAFSDVITLIKADNKSDIAVTFPNMEKWFKPDVSISLSKIRRAIQIQKEIQIRRILWAIFAETVRLTSNDRTSTYKLHARPASEIVGRNVSPIAVFENLLEQSAQDVINFKSSLSRAGFVIDDRYTRKIKLLLGNTSETLLAQQDKETGNFDLLVTSPPYGDNTSTVPYGQHAYLPLQWIDLADIDPNADVSFLRTTQEIDRRSLGGHISKKLIDEKTAELEQFSVSLANVFSCFKKAEQPPDRKARIASFYVDFIIALDRIVPSLADNAYLVWTIGNRNVGGIEIPNDQILIELLSSRRTVLVADINRNIHFKRMPSKNKIAQLMGTEKIMIFRKQPNGGLNNE
jgi:hypothetical protein